MVGDMAGEKIEKSVDQGHGRTEGSRQQHERDENVLDPLRTVKTRSGDKEPMLAPVLCVFKKIRTADWAPSRRKWS